MNSTEKQDEVIFARGFDHRIVVLGDWLIADIKPMRGEGNGKYVRVVYHGVAPNPRMNQIDYKNYEDAQKALREFYTTAPERV